MNNEASGCAVAVIVISVIGMTVIGCWSMVENHRVALELRARGLKEYDKQTGRLIWTEKAGGEKGGDK